MKFEIKFSSFSVRFMKARMYSRCACLSSGWRAWTNWILYGKWCKSLLKIHSSKQREIANWAEHLLVDVWGWSATLSCTRAMFSIDRPLRGLPVCLASATVPLSSKFWPQCKLCSYFVPRECYKIVYMLVYCLYVALELLTDCFPRTLWLFWSTEQLCTSP